ncbi:Zinc finger protein 36 C3H1 type 1 [Fasciola gigantica]|uniref:Zinc finger protein 36 C3H1 type 1 n=1 Tax=Fasciola gigantica TaxID=46835 RepID=A0A504YE05_FASGI|nr:Zinc finger protein 36 C3H1 type 1 [Fasciola gigantica]
MGGCDNCTRVQLSCIPDPANMKCSPQFHQRKSIDEAEVVLYQRLIERMSQITLNVPKPSKKPRRMPDNLRSIVETAWTACTQDRSGDLIATSESATSPLSDRSVGQAFYSNDAKPDPSFEETLSRLHFSFQPPIAVRDGTRSESRLPTKVSLSDKMQSDSNNLFDVSVNLNYQTNRRPKMRPLLRQRESYMTSINGSAHNDATAATLIRNSLVTEPKPMQVHRRQTIPRKQDAIYNARYKTQPCLHYQKYKRCPLGDNCHFAHGPDELLHPQMHPKYRTRVCLNFAQTGTCPFGKQCYFLHAIPYANIPQILEDTGMGMLTRSNAPVWIDRRHAVCGT